MVSGQIKTNYAYNSLNQLLHLEMMGATYASYHLVGAAGNITSGIFNIFEGLRSRFLRNDIDSEYNCPNSG